MKQRILIFIYLNNQSAFVKVTKSSYSDEALDSGKLILKKTRLYNIYGLQLTNGEDQFCGLQI